MPSDASRLFAQNVSNLLALMTDDGKVVPDFDDDVVAGACLTHAAPSGTPPPRQHWEAHNIMDPVTLLTVVVLAVFVGFEVVSKVTSKLHTPLMSGANAIHGIILVGAIIVAGQASDPWLLGRRARSQWSWRPSTWSAASSSRTGCWRCSADTSGPQTGTKQRGQSRRIHGADHR